MSQAVELVPGRTTAKQADVQSPSAQRGFLDRLRQLAHRHPGGQKGGATATFSFAGNEAARHAVRDVDQGQMTVSVDGGTPTTVDDYSATRNANAVVWTSGSLATGTHTVTITGLGQKNAASSGTTIALDGMDIIAY